MNWFKENWFKIILTLLACIVAFSFYHYFVVIPKQKQAKLVKDELLAKQENCRKVGQEYFEKFEKATAERALHYFSLSPLYHFNEKESTCLIETGTSRFPEGGGFITNKFILELNTNATLAELVINSKDPSSTQLEDEKKYFERKQELFELPELPKLPAE